MNNREPLSHWWWRALKRCTDILVALALLTLLTPVFTVAAIVGKIKGGKIMVRRPMGSPRGHIFGRLYLRHMRPIAALPSLFNVLRGDMSIVGPAVLPACQAEEYRAQLAEHGLTLPPKPGLTGWARATGEPDRMKADLWYARHWTPFTDIAILLL